MDVNGMSVGVNRRRREAPKASAGKGVVKLRQRKFSWESARRVGWCGLKWRRVSVGMKTARDAKESYARNVSSGLRGKVFRAGSRYRWFLSV
jgi:hypothetical protein